MKRLFSALMLSVISFAILIFLPMLYDNLPNHEPPEYERYALKEIKDLDRLNGLYTLVREITVDENTNLVLFVDCRLTNGNIEDVCYTQMYLRNKDHKRRSFHGNITLIEGDNKHFSYVIQGSLIDGYHHMHSSFPKRNVDKDTALYRLNYIINEPFKYSKSIHKFEPMGVYDIAKDIKF